MGCAPWVMPKDDAALRNLLSFARDKGYKVRISGAGHSAGGIVTDGENNQVLMLSLAEYTAPGEWEFHMRHMPDGSARATVNAGWTQAHLYQKVRPHGYFLPAQTAGYFFALGGIVANSVRWRNQNNRQGGGLALLALLVRALGHHLGHRVSVGEARS